MSVLRGTSVVSLVKNYPTCVKEGGGAPHPLGLEGNRGTVTPLSPDDGINIPVSVSAHDLTYDRTGRGYP